MKNNVRFFGFIAVAMVLFSCSKDNSASTKIQPSEPGAPGVLDPALYLLGFGASCEGQETPATAPSAADSKVVITPDDGTQTFEDGDEVLVYVSESGNTGTYVYDGENSLFVPKSDGDALAVGGSVAYVYYPASEFTVEGSTVTFTMPEAVTAGSAEDLGDKVPMGGIIPAGARDESGYAVTTFRNLGAILRCRFNSSAADGETITAVTLTVDGANITGSGTVSWGEGVDETSGTSDDIPSVAALDGNTSISIATTDGHLTSAAYKEFYFFLPVGTELSSMQVKATYGKTVGTNTYEPYETVSRNSALTPERNKIYKIQKSLSGFFAGGDGSEDYPYLISTAAEFQAISTLANATATGTDPNNSKATYDYNSTAARTFFGSAGVHYKQETDIAFGDSDSKLAISPVGVYISIPFMGTYNGDHKKLSYFAIEATVPGSSGLFEYVNNASLKNISIVDAEVTGINCAGILVGRCAGSTNIEDCDLDTGSVSGFNSVGFIAYIYDSTSVSDCDVKDITVTTNDYDSTDSSTGAYNQGGVIGHCATAGTIKNCTANGKVKFVGTKGTDRGGIIGDVKTRICTITKCTNSAAITASVNRIGGIVGYMNVGSTIEKCVNDGNISGAGIVGGIIGLLIHDDGSIENCENKKAVSGSGNGVGGITGQIEKGTVKLCANSGDVSGVQYVGGIAGQLGNNTGWGYINSCQSNAFVESTGPNGTGGIVGRMLGGVINTCFAKGSVSTSSYDVGGIVGMMYGYNNSYGSHYVYDCIAANTVTTTRNTGSANLGGVIGRLNRNSKNTNLSMAVDNCIGLNMALSTTSARPYVGAFVGQETGGAATNIDRVMVRNCISLVEDSNLSAAATSQRGGFIGRLSYGTMSDCYYVADDSYQTIDASNTTTSNLLKSDAGTLTGEEFCTEHNTRATTYSLEVNGKTYTSSGWTYVSGLGYPVPTTLYKLGESYYK